MSDDDLWKYEPLADDDAVWIVALPDCGEVYLSRAEMLEYNKNPSLWIAYYVGLASVEKLKEYTRLYGMALCGAQNKSGRPCNNVVGNFGYEAPGCFPSQGALSPAQAIG
jgi:hypothetical protein